MKGRTHRTEHAASPPKEHLKALSLRAYMANRSSTLEMHITIERERDRLSNATINHTKECSKLNPNSEHSTPETCSSYFFLTKMGTMLGYGSTNVEADR